MLLCHINDTQEKVKSLERFSDCRNVFELCYHIFTQHRSMQQCS
jgi:hypothetical protein